MSDLSDRSPEEIQSEIAATRHSLDRKLDELQHRLDPRERIEEVKGRASDAVDTARARATDMLDSARGRASDMLDSARGRASDMLGTVRGRATDMLDDARGRATGMLDSARGTISDAREKLHPRHLEPYAGWMAVGAILSGTVMAINGWRRVQGRSADSAGDVVAETDVTIVSTSDLERGTNLGDLPPAP